MSGNLSNKDLNSAKQRVYDEQWQEAVLGHAIRDSQFFLKCKSFLKPNYFLNSRMRWLCETVFALYDKRLKIPNESEIRVEAIKEFVDGKDIEQVLRKYNDCVLNANRLPIDLIREDMTAWLQMSKFSEIIPHAAQLFNTNKFQESMALIDKSVREIREVNFEKDQSFDFSDLEKVLSKINEESKDGITTGHRLLDELMVQVGETTTKITMDSSGNRSEETVPAPGLKLGDTTVLLGATNSGKTTLMVTFARNALIAGKSVIYFTHEQKDTDIVLKLTAALAELTVHEAKTAFEPGKTPQEEQVRKVHRRRIKWIKEEILSRPDRFKYIPYTKAGGMYVEDVVDIIRLMNEQRSNMTDSEGNLLGRPYDLVINDYPAKLQSKAFQGKRVEYRIEQEYIYDQFVQLALEFNVHCLVGVQSSRDGYKKNRTASDFLGMDSVAEAFGIARIASNVLTINRSEDDIKNQKMSLYIAKSRNAMTGTVFVSSTMMDRSIMFAETLRFHNHTGLPKGSLSGLPASIVKGSASSKQIINDLITAKINIMNDTEKDDYKDSEEFRQLKHIISSDQDGEDEKNNKT
jgi:replicative DNA helicase